ncbi:unnamed protein product [Paramecium sonneborni]|uniref:Uncharacterized protein n=1 Tax=Paramecium sonneborni TaxID=65129 RepID=A0A8S1N035_9CILI|nr:unnamed protein product [Paramecium sonneborni]
MQQLKQKIKPPFLLDGVCAAKRGKVLDYKAEKDSHLEQYFFNMQMRQQMIKMKQDRMSQRNLIHQQSKSFEQTIHQSNQIQLQNQPSLTQHQSATKVSNKLKVPKVSRSLSKEHFVTFLDSLITTVQNVQQLVITYFPPEKIDNQISKQQDQLRKISQATEKLSKQLRENSLPNKKEVENIKTQKNFSKLPQIKKDDLNINISKSDRGRDLTQKTNISPKLNNINLSKTLEKKNKIELQETNHHNFGFEQYESVQNNTTKKTITDKPIDQIQSERDPDSQHQKLLQIRSGQTTQLPSVRSSQQKSLYQYKKYHKEIQLALTKPKQHKNYNINQLVSQSPEQFKSKSVGTRDILQKSQSKNLKKLDFQKITSINISKVEQNKSKKNLNFQNDQAKISNTPPIIIKITDFDQQIIVEPPKNQVQLEVVEDVVQNFSNNSEHFLIEQDQDLPKTQDEDKSKLNGTAFFKQVEEEERKESIGKMIESNEISQFHINKEDSKKQLNNDQKQNDNIFITMIQNQVIENDLKMLKQQQTNYNTLNENDVQKDSEALIKLAESLDPLSDNDIVNPLENSDDELRQNQGSLLIQNLMQNSQQVIENKNSNFEYEQ